VTRSEAEARSRLEEAIYFAMAANMGTTPDELLDDYRDAVLREAADRLQARGNQIAASPPDPKLDPRAGVTYLVAEGWYQAADWLRPKETT
jgi:hypothetical protein